MTDNPADAIETMVERIEDGTYDISDDDREVLLELDKTIRLLGPSKFSTHRHEFLLRRGSVMAKRVGGLAEAVESREGAEEIVQWIHTEQTGSPETNKDYRVALRNIGKLVTEGDDFPDSVDWVPAGYPKNYDPRPDPAKMLHWDEHIQPMIESCYNSRDKALIALDWDLGPRPGELFYMKVDAITDHDYGLQVTVDGKRGRRSPILVPSAHYVNRWLDEHPGGGDDYLWSSLSEPDRLSKNYIRDILKDAADRAGVNKKVTPTRLRKSSASYLASQGVSQAHLEDHHGWTRGSDQAARYIAVFDDANEREIAKAHGLDVQEDEPEQTGPVSCPRCEQRTPREKDACVWCGQVLSQKAAEETETQRQTALDDLTEVDAELAQALSTIESRLGDDGSLRVEGLDT